MSAVLTIVSPGITTLTVSVHRGSVLPAGQLLPGAAGGVGDRDDLPAGRSGLATMIDPVSVTVAPTGTSPVHTAPVVPIDRVPELAVSLPDVADLGGRVGGGEARR